MFHHLSLLLIWLQLGEKYKIFASNEDLQLYLKKNKGKVCRYMKPIFTVEEYKEYANTQIRKLTSDEIQQYMSER